MRWEIDLDALPPSDLTAKAAQLATERRALIAGAGGNVTPINQQ